MTTIWYRDFMEFFKIKYINVFVPQEDMQLSEKLNAILRLSIYFSIIHYGLFKDAKILIIVVITMILTAVYYNAFHENYTQFAKFNKDNEEVGENGNNIEECTIPDSNNPFMNILVSDYNNPQRTGACDVDDEHVKQSIHDKFFEDTYRDIDDVFDRKSSYRNFYTTPITTIPNNQKDFAESLYLVHGKTRKESHM